MAKKHLQKLMRQITDIYSDLESTITDFAESTSDLTVLDGENLQEIKTLQSKLESSLSIYSTAIRAAYNNDLDKLFSQQETLQKAYAKPLLELLESLSKTGDKEEAAKIECLIASYNEGIQKTEGIVKILTRIKKFKDLPNKNSKRKIKYPDVIMEVLYFTATTDMITQLHQLQILHKNFLDKPIEFSTKGDLDE